MARLGIYYPQCEKQREDTDQSAFDSHNKADCPNPRSMEGVICRACNKDGHMARDCPDKAPMACRRCGEKGHMVAECPQPEICKNCNQEGEC